MLPPADTVCDVGVTAVEKSAELFRTRLVERLWLKLPLVPMTTKPNGAGGFEAVVVTVMVVEPEFETAGGLNMAVAPAGNPFTVKLTLELKPFRFPTDST